MNFNDLDTIMRQFETCTDQYVLPELWMVARLDGKGFTKLTKRMNFDKPFDDKFKSIMIKVCEHMMLNTGFKFIYAYTQSDEISLLFSFNENTFKRKTRKLNSTLAAQASVEFSLLTGEKAYFDCRISTLPSIDKVVDYFSWRQEDANRNALNGYCYWTLRDHDITSRKATSILENKGKGFKNELLFNYGINYNETPLWHRRGTGLYFMPVLKEGWNPITQSGTVKFKNVLHVEDELDFQQEYRDLIKTRCDINISSLK